MATQGTKGMKFWIGALSELANVAIIWAQLIKMAGPKGLIRSTCQLDVKKPIKHFKALWSETVD